ncbi:DegV domain-containing protein [Corynebacterium occultum]|uniref:DegV domain-containing protein n=1 Tax=Corynebacterium occultum TaxID=2675219 RepID=A0A6B8W9S8_9CORY|nr:DegV family protein [Corynebacterium occultum]QGU08025.1 DegV domain-containing protein [Corynebacterium occultum]
MAVRIVTDSSAGLPAGVIEELDITVVDLHVMRGEETSTSGLSSLELTAAYARQLERGGDDGVLALHLSKELSSTWSAAVTAAAVFDDTVKVIETASVGMAVGAAAMAAAKLALEGATLAECQDIAEDTLKRSGTWIYLHRLDELRKSGRISTATAVLSTALATKPIMKVNNGRLELAGITRTQVKAFIKLVELVRERGTEKPAFVAIQHRNTPESADKLEDMLTEALPEGSSFMILDLEDTLAVHTGDGAVGVSVIFGDHPEGAD